MFGYFACGLTSIALISVLIAESYFEFEKSKKRKIDADELQALKDRLQAIEFSVGMKR